MGMNDTTHPDIPYPLDRFAEHLAEAGPDSRHLLLTIVLQLDKALYYQLEGNLDAATDNAAEAAKLARNYQEGLRVRAEARGAAR